MTLDASGEVVDFEITPSIISVKEQLTYYDVNMNSDVTDEILLLYELARKFRKKRLENGAVYITLPEINIYLSDNQELTVVRTNRESMGRMLVSEIMIMANWLMAKFLEEHNVPAIYRSQPEPRERLYKEDQGSLFQNWMQRKQLSRFVLGPVPEHHTGLGLDAYVTATSPIRKYFDLLTQRQIRSVFGLETPYSLEEIEHIISLLEQPMGNVSRIQQSRRRYWLLKYLEKRIGENEEAIVLSKRRNDYAVLLPEYMVECLLPASPGIALKPENVVQVKIQHVNARRELLSVFLS